MQIGNHIQAFLWRSMSANNCNTYLLQGSKRVLVDPGHQAFFQHVAQQLRALDLALTDIDVVLVTHPHPDHIEAVGQLKAAGAQFGLHSDAWQLAKPMLARVPGMSAQGPDGLQPDFFLTEGDLQIGDLALEVVHTPGHAPGSVCFYLPADKALITGDVIFQDGIGRTDLPGGNGKLLKQSLETLAAIPAEFVLPGHGNIISGHKQVRANHERIMQMYQYYLD